jgi:hypothetical protein
MLKKEAKMKLRQKLAIFVVALLLSLLLFNAIVSPSLPLFKLGKEAGNKIMSYHITVEGSK